MMKYGKIAFLIELGWRCSVLPRCLSAIFERRSWDIDRPPTDLFPLSFICSFFRFRPLVVCAII